MLFRTMITLVLCAATIVWQFANITHRGKLDREFYVHKTTGVMLSLKAFIPYYAYLNVFPIFHQSHPFPTSAQEARQALEEGGSSLLTENGYSVRSGDPGKIWLFLPKVWLGRVSDPDNATIWETAAFVFILSLLGIIISAAIHGCLVFGVFLVILIGSSPTQVFETYARDNVFWLPTAVLCLLIALFLPILKGGVKSKLTTTMICITSAGLLGVASLIRNEPSVLVISCCAAMMLAGSFSVKQRLMFSTLILAVFMLTKGGLDRYFDHKYDEAVKIAQLHHGNPYLGPKLLKHTFWNAIWCGLGDFDRKYGYDWNDMTSYEYAYPILKEHNQIDFTMKDTESSTAYFDTDHKYFKRIFEMPEYLEVLRDKVLSDIQRDPSWYMGILGQRINLVLSQNYAYLAHGARKACLQLNGWMALALIVFLAVRREWFYVKTALFAIPLSATAILVFSNFYKQTIFHLVVFAAMIAFIYEKTAPYIIAKWRLARARHRVPPQALPYDQVMTRDGN